jgi:hypothetical protein
MTDGRVHDYRGVRFVFAYAKNKPADSSTVHMVLDPSADVLREVAHTDRSVCGLLAGRLAVDPPLLGEHLCARCRDKMRAATSSLQEEGDPLKEWRAHAWAGPDNWAIGINGFSELLNAIIRDVPGARFDREGKRWLVPAVYGEELSARLRETGLQVTVEQLGDPRIWARFCVRHWSAADCAELARLLTVAAEQAEQAEDSHDR